jgi:hypothetical protein
LTAFDEIVALGYKENVNLAQIRAYTEMDSHDERVHDAMRQVFSISFHNKNEFFVFFSVKNVKQKIE